MGMANPLNSLGASKDAESQKAAAMVRGKNFYPTEYSWKDGDPIALDFDAENGSNGAGGANKGVVWPGTEANPADEKLRKFDSDLIERGENATESISRWGRLVGVACYIGMFLVLAGTLITDTRAGLV